MSKVDEYINSLDGIAQEWLIEMKTFLEAKYPDKPLVSFYGMPTIKLKNRHFVAFAGNKNFFSMHTIDFEMIEELSSQLSHKEHSKATTRLLYSIPSDFVIMQDYVCKIIDKHS